MLKVAFVVFVALLTICMPGYVFEAQAQRKPVAKPTPTVLIPYRKGDKWGYCDAKKKIIIPVTYEYAFQFYEGLAQVKLDGNTGFIDKTGKVVVPLIYETATNFREGLASVRSEGKFGAVDKTGKLVIPIKYDGWFIFVEGLARVEKKGIKGYEDSKIGFIDRTGKEVVPLKYDELSSFTEGLAMARMGKYLDFKPDCCKAGFIDKTGKEVIPLTYNMADSFSEGLAYVYLSGDGPGKGLGGYIDRTGKVVIGLDGNYVSSESFHDGLAQKYARVSPYFGEYIDKTGAVVIKSGEAYEIQNDVVKSAFYEGLAPVTKNKKTGFIDKTGKIVIPLIYDEPPNYLLRAARNFSGGVAAVYKNGSFGIIDKTGKEITPFKYYTIGRVENGLVSVKLDKSGKTDGWIGRDGTEYFEYAQASTKEGTSSTLLDTVAGLQADLKAVSDDQTSLANNAKALDAEEKQHSLTGELFQADIANYDKEFAEHNADADKYSAAVKYHNANVCTYTANNPSACASYDQESDRLDAWQKQIHERAVRITIRRDSIVERGRAVLAATENLDNRRRGNNYRLKENEGRVNALFVNINVAIQGLRLTKNATDKCAGVSSLDRARQCLQAIRDGAN